MRVLVVEDEKELLRVVAQALRVADHIRAEYLR